jgi:hypothetical protein
MTERPGKPEKAGAARRATRLAEELRANLMKRKAQTRARRGGEADKRPEGFAQAKSGDKE